MSVGCNFVARDDLVNKPGNVLFPILVVPVALVALSSPVLRLLIDARVAADAAHLTADMIRGLSRWCLPSHV